MAEHPHIELGVDENGAVAWTVPVYPQRHAYLERRVGKFTDVLSGSVGQGIDNIEGFIGVAGDAAYDLLAVLIPSLPRRVSKAEFRGFRDEAAYKAGDYDEREDRSPTLPQILKAFEVAIEVNRFDVFKALKGLIDWDLMKAELSLGASERISKALSTDSQNSPSPSGESHPSDSGATNPTPEFPSTPESR